MRRRNRRRSMPVTIRNENMLCKNASARRKNSTWILSLPKSKCLATVAKAESILLALIVITIYGAAPGDGKENGFIFSSNYSA